MNGAPLLPPPSMVVLHGTWRGVILKAPPSIQTDPEALLRWALDRHPEMVFSVEQARARLEGLGRR